ncbi:hypothetical protein [Acinetobacter sp. YH12062]|nr:hypothetical protein [Acinetobacter sp. YH12062]
MHEEKGKVIKIENNKRSKFKKIRKREIFKENKTKMLNPSISF